MIKLRCIAVTFMCVLQDKVHLSPIISNIMNRYPICHVKKKKPICIVRLIKHSVHQRHFDLIPYIFCSNNYLSA